MKKGEKKKYMYIEEEIYIFKIKRNKNNFLLIMKRRKRGERENVLKIWEEEKNIFFINENILKNQLQLHYIIIVILLISHSLESI